jgi:hypothetical protein
MNLYPRWRLPDVVDANGEASIGHCEELMEDIFEHMQDSILNVLQEKFPQWKRNDSRTDSRGCTDIREGADSRTLSLARSYIRHMTTQCLEQTA